MREPAPPYTGEGPHALWHVSENDSIDRFEPHLSRTASLDERLVWAVDTRHLPLFWFPRDCPRCTYWATRLTTPADAQEFLVHSTCRVHAIESDWLERMRSTHVCAYRLPEATFVRHPEVGGYWISRERVVPVEMIELGDLIDRHEAAEIELRTERRLWLLWSRVLGSTLEYSGIRLHNAQP